MAYLRHEVAKMAGIHAETLRYYEKSGLIPLPPRDANGYRLYPQDTLKKLRLIQCAKACGLTLEETKQILSVLNMETVDYCLISEFTRTKLQEIRERISLLTRMEGLLLRVEQNINDQIECPIKNSFSNFDF